MIKILSGSLREYKRGSILTILLSILEAAFEILIPLRMADLIDQGIDLGGYGSRLEVWYRHSDFCCAAITDRRSFRTHCGENLGGLFRQSAAGYV